MPILKVAKMGNPVLRRVATPIPPEQISSPVVQQLIQNMLDTVLEYDGVGLCSASPRKCSFGLAVPPRPDEGFEVWINPVLTPTTKEELDNGRMLECPRVARRRVSALCHQG